MRALFFIAGKGLCELNELKTAKNSYFWNCMDYSDDITKPALQQLCVRFKSEEEAEEFKRIFNESKEHNEKLLSSNKKCNDDKKCEDKAEEKEEKCEEKKEEEKEQKETEEKKEETENKN